MDKTGTTAAETTKKKNINRKSQIETDVGQAGIYKGNKPIIESVSTQLILLLNVTKYIC